MASFFFGCGRGAKVEGITKYEPPSDACGEFVSQPKQRKTLQVKAGLQKTRSENSQVQQTAWWSRKMIQKEKSKHQKCRKSTVNMRKHHHATFAHLIHDSLIRLKCSPRHHSGYSKKRISRNITRHYRLKLGKKFLTRLKKSLTKLVHDHDLVVLGNKRSGLRYKPSTKFLKHFSQLKVIDGAANRQHALKIHRHIRHYRSPGQSRSRSGSRRRHRSRSGSRRRHKSRSRSRRRHNSRSSSKNKRSQSHHWSNRRHKESHHGSPKSEHETKLGIDHDKASQSKGIVGWLWPDTTENVQEGGDKAPNEADDQVGPENSCMQGGSMENCYRFDHGGRKRKGRDDDASSSGRRRYQKFKRTQIRANAEDVSPKEISPMADSSSVKIFDSSDDEFRSTTMEDVEEESETTSRSSSSSRSQRKHKSLEMEEHNTLHSLKKSSESPYQSPDSSPPRSFLERLGESVRSALSTSSTQRSSIAHQEQHFGSQNPSKIQPNSKRPFKPSESQNLSQIAPMSKRTSQHRKSRSSGHKVPLTPRLSGLLPE